MNNDELFLEDLLNRNDFLVKVVLLDENILAVDYAGKKQVIYSLQFNDDDIIYINYKYNDITEIFILHWSIVRLFILMDIHKECRRLGLPDNILRFYSKEEKKSTLMDILPLELSQQELINEKLLNNAMERAYNKPDMINRMDDKLEKMGLLKQFTLLKGLLI